MKKIVLLYSQANFVWTSMEEIIPYIKRLWEDYGQQRGCEVKVITVDEGRPSQFRQELFSCDLIIVSCFNGKMAQWLRIIRDSLGINAPWGFYLHNQATLGLWPLYELKIGELLRQDDIFIGTCEGDKLSLDLCFENIQFFLQPFSSPDVEKIEITPKENILDFVFIGRISRQKNLEKLIEGFDLLIKEDKREFQLHFYGKEDYLGYPNLGLKSEKSYLEELKSLVSKLGRDQNIHFHGFCPREEIAKKWKNKDFVFCSPSFHSDENFGMAAFMALRMGAPLVLSDWGGHKNYNEKLSSGVFTFPIYHNGESLECDPQEVAENLKLSLKAKYSETDFFSYSQILSCMQNFFKERKGSKEQLKLTEFGKKLLAQREELKKDNPQKAFHSLSDPLLMQFYRCYGALEK